MNLFKKVGLIYLVTLKTRYLSISPSLILIYVLLEGQSNVAWCDKNYILVSVGISSQNDWDTVPQKCKVMMYIPRHNSRKQQKQQNFNYYTPCCLYNVINTCPQVAFLEISINRHKTVLNLSFKNVTKIGSLNIVCFLVAYLFLEWNSNFFLRAVNLPLKQNLQTTFPNWSCAVSLTSFMHIQLYKHLWNKPTF